MKDDILWLNSVTNRRAPDFGEIGKRLFHYSLMTNQKPFLVWIAAMKITLSIFQSIENSQKLIEAPSLFLQHIVYAVLLEARTTLQHHLALDTQSRIIYSTDSFESLHKQQALGEFITKHSLATIFFLVCSCVRLRTMKVISLTQSFSILSILFFQ